MEKRVLITGLDGFVASTLADHILSVEPDALICGTVRRMSDRKNILHLDGQVKLIDMELTDMNSVMNAVRIASPTHIFHLAAQSFVPTSWSAPGSTLQTNVIGTSNLLEAVRMFAPKAFVQVAGSSEEYGMVSNQEIPITEEQPLRPLSPYGVSKVATDRLGYQYAKSYGLNVLITRSFNMCGPRRGKEFVDSDWANQIVNIERGNRPPMIYHGNLTSVRDFTDVRDSVRAYWLLANLERDHSGDVVQVCTGHGHAMEYVLSTLINLSKNELAISHMADPKKMRPSDVQLLIGSYDKLHELTGWQPKIRFEESMNDLLDYWRGIL